ncbi:hypothetical protein [Colwellia sp. RSH04]|uniref:hypothetical protein n=1 Tax=Colwellia sp. RSH04 TaxID=2305464 RepID=UPI000E573F29|nr:hypothetical protein [Colwellia sp. RSH04]RHW74718.1 hypothetical protein D1094_17410 [Colwellia sp. RSH04]
MNTVSQHKSNNTINTKHKGLASFCGGILITSAFLSASVQADDNNYSKINRQLEVMNNIIKSSVTVGKGNSKTNLRSVESVYLHGQGAVFTINSDISRSFNRHNMSFVMPSAPIAPVSVRPNEVIEIDEDVVIHSQSHARELELVVSQMESEAQEFERVVEVMEGQREQSRELRHEQREIAYELRDNERESKDYSFQLKHADKQDKKKLNEKLAKLEKEKLELKKSKAKLDAKVKKINQQQKQLKVAQAQERKAHYKSISSSLIDTFCLYGNGLKSLPNDEHVSIILKWAGDKSGRHYQDKIFVFNKKDINACASDKITSKKLLSKAEQYQF